MNLDVVETFSNDHTKKQVLRVGLRGGSNVGWGTLRLVYAPPPLETTSCPSCVTYMEGGRFTWTHLHGGGC